MAVVPIKARLPDNGDMMSCPVHGRKASQALNKTDHLGRSMSYRRTYDCGCSWMSEFVGGAEGWRSEFTENLLGKFISAMEDD